MKRIRFTSMASNAGQQAKSRIRVEDCKKAKGGGAKMRPDGAIAGIGVVNSKSYLMRLDPVPEPASLLALAAGLCAILTRRRAP